MQWLSVRGVPCCVGSVLHSLLLSRNHVVRVFGSPSLCSRTIVQGFDSRMVGQSLKGVGLWDACYMHGSQRLFSCISLLLMSVDCLAVRFSQRVYPRRVVAFSAFVEILPQPGQMHTAGECCVALEGLHTGLGLLSRLSSSCV